MSGTIRGAPVIGDYDDVTTVEGALSRVRPPGFPQDYSVTGALGVDPLEKDDVLSGADKANPQGFLDRLGLKGFSAEEAIVKTAINAAFGKPVTFFVDLLQSLLPPADPRATAMSDFYKRDDIGRVAEGELMAGYNPVSGGFLNMITGGRLGEPTQYGLQEAYDDRIGNVTSTLQSKYGLTKPEIDQIKAGNITDAIKAKTINPTMSKTYGKPTVTNLVQELAQLEIDKNAEKGRLDLFSGDVDPSGEGTGDASIAEQIAEADRLGISGDIGVEGEDEGRFTTTTPTVPDFITPTVPDFISGGGRDDSPAPSAPPSKPSAPPSQPRGGGSDASQSDFSGGNVTDSKSGDTYGGEAYGYNEAAEKGNDSGGGGGCFLKGTQVTMADGSTKAIEQVDLGDKVAKGGKVFATGKFLVENLHDYKGIKVSGSHMVNEDGNWARVEDSKHGKALGDDEHTVYVFGAENRRILINGILFTDYFETTEQEKLINNEKDFFNNWKTYENKIDQDNINILNAS
jgi:hypothetical protein